MSAPDLCNLLPSAFSLRVAPCLRQLQRLVVQRPGIVVVGTVELASAPAAQRLLCGAVGLSRHALVDDVRVSAHS